MKSERVQRYLHNAEKCECKAGEAVDAHTKKIFLECVYQWRQLARQVEELERGRGVFQPFQRTVMLLLEVARLQPCSACCFCSPPDVHLSGELKHCALTHTQHTGTPLDQECSHLCQCSRLLAFAACIVGRHVDSRNALSCPLGKGRFMTRGKRISEFLFGRIGTI